MEYKILTVMISDNGVAVDSSKSFPDKVNLVMLTFSCKVAQIACAPAN